MGKSTKWLKNVLLGKKPSKPSGSKEKEVNKFSLKCDDDSRIRIKNYEDGNSYGFSVLFRILFLTICCHAQSGKEVLVTAKVEESDVVSDLPSFANAATDTVDRSSGVSEKQNVEPEEISDDETQLPEEKPADYQNAASVQDNSLSDAERIQQEIAATSVQAAFRGYLVIFFSYLDCRLGSLHCSFFVIGMS